MQKKYLIFVCMILELVTISACAEFAFPSSLSLIGEEAFAEASLPAAIVLPEALTSIGDEAFRACEDLRDVTIPDSVSTIGADVFSGCGEALVLRCAPNSTASTYARENQIDWRAGTICRALIISQTYAGTNRALYGPGNDSRAIRACLSHLEGDQYQVYPETNLTAEEILSVIGSTFADATAEDIMLFYYSGHGMSDGSLLGTDGAEVTPAALRTALDAVPGRKVVVVDACASGQLINPSLEAATADAVTEAMPEVIASIQGDADGFVAGFRSAFAPRKRGALNADGYFVITSAHEEDCDEGYITSGSARKIMGYFTYGFCLGCGWDGVSMQACALAADANGDGAVSIQEAYVYARDYAINQNPSQSAAVWPEDCLWFSPFRS